MNPFLQIWNYAVTDAAWVPLVCPVAGSCLKAWFLFNGDLHLRSDPNNRATDYLAQVSQGNEMSLPFLTAVTMDGERPMVYAQAASGSVDVTLFCLMQ